MNDIADVLFADTLVSSCLRTFFTRKNMTQQEFMESYQGRRRAS